jgi:tetratricopeptide (TPR) repeat protein
MWWLWENVRHPNLEGAYSALGAWGQGITVYPEMNVVLAYKTNSIYRRSNNQIRLNELVAKVARMYDEESGTVKNRLYASFMGSPPENAIMDFRRTRREYPDTDLEPFLNMLGYEFLANREYDKALAVFGLNVEENPGSWNAYDSFAEGYEQSGDIPNAIKNYQRSLEINPGNYHGRERLKILHSRFPTL